MKTKLLSMALLASSFVFSQQAQTFSEVTIQNYSPLLYLKRSVNDGGFIRGIQTQYQNGGNGWFFGDLYGTYWVVSKGDHNDAKFLINENGNVGIGTVGPLSKLHVAGTIMAGAGDSVTGVNAFSIPYANGSICNWGSLRSTGSSYMSYGVKASGTNAGWLSSSGDTSFVKTAITLDDGGFRLLASSSQKVAIDSPVMMPEILKVSASGNALLQGKFEAKEIKVTLSPTADFVFAENYDLPKLEDIEKHIKEKKHLPEIASAKVMEKEGVNVGEFQIKLLQKIEELTLYSIEQNKQLKALQQENKILKSQSEEIQELKKQVQMLLNMKK